jgi:hypothetical protein
MTRPPAARGLAALVPCLLFGAGACAWMAERSQPPDREPERARFHLAVSTAERGDFQGASRQLKALASRCESGAWGREAVLVLASLELSPGNPEGSPDGAATLLGRYLQSPTALAGSVALAETLYLLALELGAAPLEDPLAPSPATEVLAPAWEGCPSPAEPVVIRSLPEHPGPTTLAETLQAGVARQEALENRADSLNALVETLRARNATLEAELERIRRLLLPDTAQSTPTARPPGR